MLKQKPLRISNDPKPNWALLLFVVYLVWLVCPIAGWRILLGWKQVGGLMLAAGQDLSSSQGWWSCQVSGEETVRRKCWRFPPSYSAAHSRRRQDCSLWKEKKTFYHPIMICHALDHYIGCCLVSILYNGLPVIFDPEMSNSTSLVSWKWSSEVTRWQPRIGAWKGVVSLWKSFTGADSVDLFSISGVLSWMITGMHQFGTFNEYL